MKDRYIKLKIELVVNKLLYKKNIINKNLYEQTSKKIDKLLFEENKNNLLEPWRILFVLIK